MCKISFIVPVYNVEKYLNRCVDSILSQSFTDFEVILIDDGSPDNCHFICDEYAKKDPRVKVIHQTNHGLGSVRNRGMEIAEGEWISFVDSDDWIHPDYAKILMESEEPGVDIIQFNNQYIGTYDYFKNSYKFSDGYLDLSKDFTTSWWYMVCWNRIYRKDFLDAYYIRFPINLKIAEDIFFSYVSFFHANKIKTVKEDLYYYFMNPGSAIHKVNYDVARSRCDVVESVNKYLDACDKNKKKYFKIEELMFDSKMWFLENGYYKEFRNIFSNVSIKDPSFVNLSGFRFKIYSTFAHLHLDFMGKPLYKTFNSFLPRIRGRLHA